SFFPAQSAQERILPTGGMPFLERNECCSAYSDLCFGTATPAEVKGLVVIRGIDDVSERELLRGTEHDMRHRARHRWLLRAPRARASSRSDDFSCKVGLAKTVGHVCCIGGHVADDHFTRSRPQVFGNVEPGDLGC
ncbi:unnamed protein product, partial [Ectocarpus fasciculatus]